jgi:hypothetical protein
MVGAVQMWLAISVTSNNNNPSRITKQAVEASLIRFSDQLSVGHQQVSINKIYCSKIKTVDRMMLIPSQFCSNRIPP